MDRREAMGAVQRAIGEVLAYSRALSSAERAGIEAYMKAKWRTS